MGQVKTLSTRYSIYIGLSQTKKFEQISYLVFGCPMMRERIMFSLEGPKLIWGHVGSNSENNKTPLKVGSSDRFHTYCVVRGVSCLFLLAVKGDMRSPKVKKFNILRIAKVIP